MYILINLMIIFFKLKSCCINWRKWTANWFFLPKYCLTFEMKYYKSSIHDLGQKKARWHRSSNVVSSLLKSFHLWNSAEGLLPHNLPDDTLYQFSKANRAEVLPLCQYIIVTNFFFPHRKRWETNLKMLSTCIVGK